ncbi:MAG TPA: penicillin-binding transpeptidase domain-containing protein [Solirubrobacteraceae bacterium]
MTVGASYLEPGGARPRRRRRFSGRVAAGVLLALAVAGGAAYVITQRLNSGRPVVERFARAWQRDDYAAMYREVDPAQRRRVSLTRFRAAYQRAGFIATQSSLRTGSLKRDGDGFKLKVHARTRVFGVVTGDVHVPLTGGDPRHVRWSTALTFPGLSRGHPLRRVARVPKRAALLSRDGKLLADGDNIASPLGSQIGIVGDLGEAQDLSQVRALVMGGFPAKTPVGTSGLQRALNDRLLGKAGGTLFAGRTVLARVAPRRAHDVRASIDAHIQAAAASALGGQFGGVAVLDPSTGEVLALAGIATDGAQPPGSTFKIMTVTAALEDHIVTLASRFPVQTGANVGGRFLANANNESCGGDLTASFSKSCNSVFAPIGVKLGAKRLVDVAERFGFNEPPPVPGAKPDQIPKAGEMTGPDEVGSSAIGQGRVLATPLGMATVGATIANAGRRARLTLVHGEPPRFTKATTPQVAATVRQLMLAVVNGAGATGNAAAIPGVQVAGKTGTAELGGSEPNDAWFVAFAPAQQPRLAVGVLVVHGGFGGDSAAPIARKVLQAGLGG